MSVLPAAWRSGNACARSSYSLCCYKERQETSTAQTIAYASFGSGALCGTLPQTGFGASKAVTRTTQSLGKGQELKIKGRQKTGSSTSDDAEESESYRFCDEVETIKRTEGQSERNRPRSNR